MEKWISRVFCKSFKCTKLDWHSHYKLMQLSLDLNTCKISNFKRELNMKEGWLGRSFNAILPTGEEIEVNAKRFISVKYNEVGAIEYPLKAVNFSGEITFSPYLDAGIENEDSNYDEYFWETLKIVEGTNQGCILAKTLKTEFHVATAMDIDFAINGKTVSAIQTTYYRRKSIIIHL